MAHERDMYIGTRQRMAWIPAPKVEGYNPTDVGYFSQQDFLNGGTRIRRSVASHKEYTMAWNLITREQQAVILDMYSGLYGTGPLYFLDPAVMAHNVAPKHWAAPMMGGYDAPLLVKGNKPVLSDTPTLNNLNYPVQTASYTTGDKRKLFIPIPSGYTLWAGAHGPSSSIGHVVVAPVLTPTNVGLGTALPMLGTDSTTRVNFSFAGTACIGVEVSLQDNTTYTGLILQILQDGVTPATGAFITGRGHSGMAFKSTPTQSLYSSVLNKVGVSIEMAEVNDWLSS